MVRDRPAWSLVETGATTVRSYGGIDALPNGIVLAAATNVQQLCEVIVADSGVLPSKTSSGFGTTIAWSIDATGQVSTISVAMTATPTTGPTSTALTIGGRRRARRPASSTTWSSSGLPRQPMGGDGKSAGWSPAKTITVN